MTASSVPPEVIAAISRAVWRQGGTKEDAEDLIECWERLCADKHGRLDRLRYEAANSRCSCADGGQPDKGGRCNRCYGKVPV